MSVLPKPVILTAVIAVLLALLPLPYGYYQLLRVLLGGVFAYAAMNSWKALPDGLIWVMVGFTFIYNPLFPLHLGREIWTIVNLGTAGFLVCLMQLKILEKHSLDDQV